MEPVITSAQVIEWIGREYPGRNATDLYRKFLGQEHAAMFEYVAELIKTDTLGEIPNE